MTAIGYYFGILCLLFTRASALKSLARLQSFSWKLFTTAPLHFENTRFINLYTYPSNFVKSITQTDAALMPSNYQITEQIWRHTCVETMIGNSKSTSWGRNLIAPVDIDTCTYGVVLALLSPWIMSAENSLYCQPKKKLLLWHLLSAGVFCTNRYVCTYMYRCEVCNDHQPLLYALLRRNRKNQRLKITWERGKNSISWHQIYMHFLCVSVGILLTSMMTM